MFITKSECVLNRQSTLLGGIFDIMSLPRKTAVLDPSRWTERISVREDTWFSPYLTAICGIAWPVGVFL